MNLINADCMDAMRDMEADSIDAIITDPPYGLAFMGVKWDTFANEKGRADYHSTKFDCVGGNHHPCNAADGARTKISENTKFQTRMTEVFSNALRIAKPGAPILAFGGTRTYHRLGCAIEDAGWEVRDCLMWVYGSGFPKSMDVSKAIDKAAGAKREKLPNPYAKQQTASIGTIAYGDFNATTTISPIPATDAAKQWQGWGTCLKPAWEPIIIARKPLDGTVAHNVLTYGTGALNIDACRVGTENMSSQFDRTWKQDNSFGNGKRASRGKIVPDCRFPANVIHDGSEEATAPMGDASRFFYCAKASRKDRGEGNDHPTVKPTKLMEWLVNLTTRPDSVVLDPFMGSGSTGIACANLGRSFVGIERDKHYFEIAKSRIEKQYEQRLF